MFANEHMGRKKQYQLKVFSDDFLSMYVQNTICLWCIVIQPGTSLIVKWNLPFGNLQVNGEARGRCSDLDQETTIHQGMNDKLSTFSLHPGLNYKGDQEKKGSLMG